MRKGVCKKVELYFHFVVNGWKRWDNDDSYDNTSQKYLFHNGLFF